jgi:hypothetical protein
MVRSDIDGIFALIKGMEEEIKHLKLRVNYLETKVSWITDKEETAFLIEE